jgi:aerobic-type carbon monoxide dehydrogenase small subunit (CoxS/CutS family)
MAYTIMVNGTHRGLDPAKPLLWVLHDQLGLKGHKYGCGVGLMSRNAVIAQRVTAMSTTALLSNNTRHADAEIDTHMSSNLCRCANLQLCYPRGDQPCRGYPQQRG